MKIIAHRGYSAVYPENTMLAFRKAAEAGADGIELDVHLSRDGECMVIHDEALARTTGLPGSVQDYSRNELEAMDAGYVKGGRSGFCPIPPLEEVLDYLSDKDVLLNIELKTAPVCYPGIEEKVLALVSKHSMADRVIYSSFNWLSVWRMRELGATSPLGLLQDGQALTGLGAQMKALGIECYHPSCRMLSDVTVAELKANERKINVWTVDRPEDILRCKAWGIDGLITNNPWKSRQVAEA